MRRVRRKAQREPTVSLINIVFLILIFFMLTGTLARPVSPDLELVRTQGLDRAAAPGLLEIAADGNLRARGEAVTDLAAYLDGLPPDDPTVRLAPDRRLPARALLRLVTELRAAGAARIVIVTEDAPR